MILRKDFNVIKLFLLFSLLIVCQGQYNSNGGCFDQFNGWYLDQLSIEERIESSISNCKASCLTADFRCKSVQYDRENQICSLSVETKDSRPKFFRQHSNFVYWQKKPECQPECYVKAHKDFVIFGLDNKILNKKSYLECMESCLLWEPFKCNSADYSEKNGLCYLSVDTRFTRPTKFNPHKEHWHFERKCPNYGCFDVYDNKYFSLTSPLIKTVKNEEECIDLCMHERSIRCQSAQFNKHSRECYLYDFGKESIETDLKTDAIFTYFDMKKSCRSTCKLTRHHGKYLDIYNIKKVIAYSDLECMELCLSSKEPCNAVQRFNNTNECFLLFETKTTKPTKFRNAKFRTYWDWDCGCFEEHRQMFLQSLNIIAIPESTPDKCKARCLTAEFRCKSAEFNIQTNQCFLSKETRLTKPSSFKPNPNYYYWTRKTECQPKCYLAEQKGWYLQYHNTLFRLNMDLLPCLETCYFTNTFDCKSVEYNNVTRNCILSVETKDTKPNDFHKKESVTYHQKVCHNNYPCFSSTAKRYMKGIATIFKAKSEKDCVKTCMEGGRPCRSVSYNTKNRDCRLSIMTKDSHPQNYETDNNYIYFERKMDCRRDCYLNRFKDFSLTSPQLLSKKTVDELECIKTCLQHKPLGTCKSVRRSLKTGICVLHGETRLTNPSKFKKVNGIIYWELTCGDKCFEEKLFKYLDGYGSYTIQNSNLEKCKDACLMSNFSCKSANFDQFTKMCSLSTETSKTKPDAFKIGSNSIYIERKEDCLPKCFMKEKRGYYLLGFNRRTYNVKNEYECKKLCLLDKDKKCLSVEYHLTTSTCYLNSESHLTKPLNLRTSSSYVYWHKKCGKDDPCFKKYLGFGLEKHYYTILTGKTEETCVRACFMSYCRSATYNVDSKECFLSRTTKLMYPKSFKTNKNLVYLEKRESCKPNCKVLTFSGRNLIGYEVKQVKAPTNEDCIRACMTFEGNCRSADRNIKTNVCNLHIETKNTKPLSYKPNLLYVYWELQCNLCFIELDNKRPSIETGGYVLNLKADECKSECLQRRDCGLVTWNKQNNKCHIWSNNTSEMISDKEYIYWKVDPDCKSNCYLKKYKNRYMIGSNTKAFIASSETMCAELCLNHKEDCKSAEYNRKNGRCIVSIKSKDDNPSSFDESTLHVYWEKLCGDEQSKQFPCFTTFKNNFLIGHNDLILDNQTKESCVYACLTADFPCLSAEYSLIEKKCYLSRSSKDTQKEKMKYSEFYEYYHRKSECKPRCVIKTYEKKVLMGHNIEILSDLKKFECISKCLTNPSCNSVEYDHDSKLCYLQTETSKTKPLNFQDSDSYTYWEVVCQDSCYFEEYSGKSLQEETKISRLLSNSNQCKNACITEKKFNCRSAEYNEISKTCFLMEENLSTKPNNLMNYDLITYYDKICGSGSRYCFKKTDNLQLNHLIKFYEGIPIDTCMQRCLTLSNHLCRSITYHKLSNTCYLSDESKTTKSFQTSKHNEYTYYHRLEKCMPNCKVIRRPNKYLVGFDTQSYKTPDEASCVRQCLIRGQNKCRSVEWNRDTFMCFQQMETKETRPLKYVNSREYVYYDIKC